MSWPMVRLGDCCDVKSGATPKTDIEKYWDGEIRWATPKDISRHEHPYLFDTSDKITVEGYRSCSTQLLPVGTVLVSSRAPIGLVAIAGVEMCTNQGFKNLVPGPEVYSNYLYHCMKANAARLAALGNGATFKEVSKSIVENFEIPLPPVQEQQRISAILDKANSLRRKRQEAIRRTDELLRALFIDMYGDPSKNPKGWPVLRMGDVIDFKGGSQPPKDCFIDEPRPGYVRLVQIRDFKTDRYKTYIPESLAKRFFEVDDVMIARYGPPVFQILRGLSGSYNVALMKAQPRQNVLPEFIFWLLQLPKYQQAVISNSERTAGQTGVNLDFLNALEVPLPPISYQGEIARMTQRISLLISKQREMLDACNSQVAALQSQFFD